MTDIEKKALALLNELSDYEVPDLDEAQYSTAIQAICRAIEQHEAFKREVSDAVEEIAKVWGTADPAWGYLRRFIIAKPDPLVEVLQEISGEGGYDNYDHYAYRLQSAIEARGGRIVWEGE